MLQASPTGTSVDSRRPSAWKAFVPLAVVLLFVFLAALVHRHEVDIQLHEEELGYQERTQALENAESAAEDYLLNWRGFEMMLAETPVEDLDSATLRHHCEVLSKRFHDEELPLAVFWIEPNSASAAHPVATTGFFDPSSVARLWWQNAQDSLLRMVRENLTLALGSFSVSLERISIPTSHGDSTKTILVLASAGSVRHGDSGLCIMLIPSEPLLDIINQPEGSLRGLQLGASGTLAPPSLPQWIPGTLAISHDRTPSPVTYVNPQDLTQALRADFVPVEIGCDPPLWMVNFSSVKPMTSAAGKVTGMLARLAPVGVLASGFLLALYLWSQRRSQQRAETLIQAQLESHRALERSQQRIRSIVEGVDLLAVVCSPDGRILYCNQSILLTTGYSLEELEGQTWFHLFNANSLPPDLFQRAGCATGQASERSENLLVDRHGNEHTILWSHTSSCNDAGEVESITSLGLDVTGYRQAKRELVRLSKTIEQGPLSVVITDTRGSIEWVNPAFTKLTGYTLDECKGKNPRILKSGLVDHMLYTDLWRTISSGKIWQGELLNRAKDGSLFWESATIAPVFDDEQRIIEYVGIKQDITARIESEMEMNKLSAAIAQSANHIALLDPHGRIEYANPSFCESVGITAARLSTMKIDDLLPEDKSPAPFPQVIEKIKKDKVWRASFPVTLDNGKQYWIRCSISAIHRDNQLLSYLMVGEDITTEVATMEKLTESEKMAAIGVLAAGVSHEFKNLLAGIMGNASLALEELESNAPGSQELARETFEQVIEISERANQVAMSLLTYSKASTADFTPQDLPKLIASTVSLIESELKSRGIEVVTYSDALPLVEMDAGKIQQLILNLLINAEHAMSGPGVITIAALRESQWVQVRIGDTGCGIPKENLHKIFDPFFSTKGVWGKDTVAGTGMGLSICRNLAREHGGEITVASRVGIGSTFTLTIPLTRNQVDGSETEPPLPTHRQIVLFTLDRSIFSSYFPQACERDISLVAVDSINRVDRDLATQTCLFVCDARFTGKVELFKVIETCRLAGVPYVMINCGAMEYQLSHLYDHARENFSALPAFEELLPNCNLERQAGPVMPIVQPEAE